MLCGGRPSCVDDRRQHDIRLHSGELCGEMKNTGPFDRPPGRFRYIAQQKTPETLISMHCCWTIFRKSVLDCGEIYRGVEERVDFTFREDKAAQGGIQKMAARDRHGICAR